jgi:hypothetical protein
MSAVVGIIILLFCMFYVIFFTRSILSSGMRSTESKGAEVIGAQSVDK